MVRHRDQIHRGVSSEKFYASFRLYCREQSDRDRMSGCIIRVSYPPPRVGRLLSEVEAPLRVEGELYCQLLDEQTIHDIRDAIREESHCSLVTQSIPGRDDIVHQVLRGVARRPCHDAPLRVVTVGLQWVGSVAEHNY